MNCLIVLPVVSLISEPIGDIILASFAAFDVKAMVLVLVSALPC